MNSIRHYWDKICRMCYWGWTLRNSYDWDYGYLDQIIHLKLDRMQKNMSKYGHGLWNSNPDSKEYWLMRKLEQAVYTSGIINNSNDEPIYQQQQQKHEDKYGKMLFGDWEIKDLELSFSKCTSKEQGDRAWKEYHAIEDEHAVRIKQYRKHLHMILYKYGKLFWD